MRYVGQVHECTVDIDMFEINDKTIERVKEAFHRRHEELYTYSERHSLVEVVNIESTLYGLIDKPKLPALKKGVAPERAIKHHRKSIFSADGKGVRVAVYDGAQLGAGANIAGPAIIEEITTTIVIEPGWTRETARERIVCDHERGFAASGKAPLGRQGNGMRTGGTMKPKENRSMTK